MRSELFNVKLSPEERQLLKGAAALERVSESECARRAIRERVTRVLGGSDSRQAEQVQS